MLEKSGQIVLTPEDLRLYNQGLVSERIQELWGPITLGDLKKLVDLQNNEKSE